MNVYLDEWRKRGLMMSKRKKKRGIKKKKKRNVKKRNFFLFFFYRLHVGCFTRGVAKELLARQMRSFTEEITPGIQLDFSTFCSMLYCARRRHLG